MNTTGTFIVIEHNCRDLSDLRAKLRRKLEAKKKAQDAIDTEHNADLRALQEQCNAARAALLANLSVGREHFLSPKTREFHGITVGFAKKRDTVTCPPDAVLVDRIEKLLPAKQGETVLDRSVTIIKAAFNKLDRDILQKLGCSITKGADEAVVRTTDDDVEELAKKTLGDAVPKKAGV